MSRFGLHLRAALERLGWPGVTGIALLVFALAAYASAIAPARGELAELTRQAGDAGRAPRAVTEAPRLSPAAERLADFYRRFPPEQDLTQSLGVIYSAAADAGLTLSRGTYKLGRDPRGAFLRYDIELPVRGAYPRIQIFAYDALKKLPALALQDVSFKRERADAAEIDAKLRFTLYMVER